MTKKDYIRFVNLFRNYYKWIEEFRMPDGGNRLDPKESLKAFEDGFVNLLVSDNPKFDIENWRKFMDK